MCFRCVRGNSTIKHKYKNCYFYFKRKQGKQYLELAVALATWYNVQYCLDEKGNPKVYMLYGHVHDTYDQWLIEQFQKITMNGIRENPDGERGAIPSNMLN